MANVIGNYVPLEFTWQKDISVERYLQILNKLGVNQGKRSQTLTDKDIGVLLKFCKANNYCVETTNFSSNSEIATLSKKIATYGFGIKKSEINVGNMYDDLLFVYMNYAPKILNNNKCGIWQLRYNFVLALKLFLQNKEEGWAEDKDNSF